MSLIIKSENGLNKISAAKIIRNKEFFEEQGFQNALFEKEKPIATERCYKDKEDKMNYHIGRIAVLKTVAFLYQIKQ